MKRWSRDVGKKLGSTAIRLGNAQGVVFKDVRITGFDRGIVAENSSLTADGLEVTRSQVGLELREGSKATLRNSTFRDNGIDIVRHGNSELTLIETYAQRVLALDVAALGAAGGRVKERARKVKRSKTAWQMVKHAAELLTLLEGIQKTVEFARGPEVQQVIEGLRTVLARLHV